MYTCVFVCVCVSSRGLQSRLIRGMGAANPWCSAKGWAPDRALHLPSASKLSAEVLFLGVFVALALGVRASDFQRALGGLGFNGFGGAGFRLRWGKVGVGSALGLGLRAL